MLTSRRTRPTGWPSVPISVALTSYLPPGRLRNSITVVRGAFSLLDLIAFFTAGEDKPAQSWHLRRGLSVWHAAGQIHSDIQRGFVRAEVIGWDALVDAGGYAGARERGTPRIEGRDYQVADGDVITVRFTP